MTPDLQNRHREPERMDAPDFDPQLHHRALNALARVNRVSGGPARVWHEVRRASEEGPHDGHAAPLRLLDVACGGGDVMIEVARRARSRGLPLEVHGCDLSPVALEHARVGAERAGVAVELSRLNVLTDSLPGGYDLVCSSLFLHHLSDVDAVDLLRKMADVGRRLLVQDLVRSRLGYALAWGGVRLLSRSRVAHVDGPLSVRAAFTPAEAETIAARAGLRGAVVRRAWPERFVLTWRRA